MAESAEDICNLALSRVGQKKFITSLEADNSVESEVCAAVYEPVRDQLLQMFAWPFAQRRAELAAVVETGDRDEEFAYVYALPPDCLQPQYIPTGYDRSADRLDRVPFRLEAGEAVSEEEGVSTTVLLTDAEDATLVYTAKLTAVQLYPPMFVNALAWMIASELTLSLSIAPRLLPLIEQKKNQALLQASKIAVDSEMPDAEPESKFVTER